MSPKVRFTYSDRGGRTIAGDRFSPYSIPSSRITARSGGGTHGRTSSVRRTHSCRDIHSPGLVNDQPSSMTSKVHPPVLGPSLDDDAKSSSNLGDLIQRLKQELVLRETITKLELENAHAERRLQAVSSALQSEATCTICFSVMGKPYCLRSCGHSFCHDCIRTLLLTDIRRHLEKRYDIPLYLRNVSEGTTPAQLGHLRRYLIGGTRSIPPSKCPLCREDIAERPGQVDVLGNLISALASSATPADRANDLHVVDSAGAFEGFFVY